MNDSHSQPKFSEEIRALLEHLSREPLTLAHILSETSERSFSLVIGLLVLPFLFPMPPGVSTILGRLVFYCQHKCYWGGDRLGYPEKLPSLSFLRG